MGSGCTWAGAAGWTGSAWTGWAASGWATAFWSNCGALESTLAATLGVGAGAAAVCCGTGTAGVGDAWACSICKAAAELSELLALAVRETGRGLDGAGAAAGVMAGAVLLPGRAAGVLSAAWAGGADGGAGGGVTAATCWVAGCDGACELS